MHFFQHPYKKLRLYGINFFLFFFLVKHAYIIYYYYRFSKLFNVIFLLTSSNKEWNNIK